MIEIITAILEIITAIFTFGYLTISLILTIPITIFIVKFGYDKFGDDI